MEKVQLVYAELVNGVSFTMLEDPLVHIIADNAIFLVTTSENSSKYDVEFYAVDEEAMESYHLEFENGRLTGDIC